MRSLFVASLATVALAQRGRPRGGGGPGGGRWWGGAPECAHDCLSSIYDEKYTDTAWPGPGHFCTNDVAEPLSTCLSNSCTETLTAWSSFSSLRQSVCSVYASCTDSPDQVVTLTYSAPTGTDGAYPWGHPHRGGYWRTYTGDGTITVTGCPTGGYGHGPGYGRHRGWMPWGADRPDDAWWGWGYGWSSLTTYTTTMTQTAAADGGDGTASETVVVETVAQAVSDGVTQTSPIGADEAANTGTPDGGDDAGGSGSGNGNAASGNDVKLLGVALAAVIGVAAAL